MIENQTKPRDSEDSCLCPEILTKNAVQEIYLCKADGLISKGLDTKEALKKEDDEVNSVQSSVCSKATSASQLPVPLLICVNCLLSINFHEKKLKF
jgi:hypothetical protein